MNKILRIQYDALSLTHAFFHRDQWVNRDQLASLFNEFRMKLLSSMGLPPWAGRGCGGPVESYEYGLEFYPTDSVIVQGDPKNLDLMLIKAAPHRVYLTWEEIELPESLKQLYNLNTQENTTMTKPKQIPIPYFTASGEQYWYDPVTDRVGVGNKLHAKGKTTFLFAAKIGPDGDVVRSKRRYSVHISNIRSFANQKQAAPVSETTKKSVGAWPQPVSNVTPVVNSQLEQKVDELTAKIAQLSTTITLLSNRLSNFDGLIRK